LVATVFATIAGKQILPKMRRRKENRRLHKPLSLKQLAPRSQRSRSTCSPIQASGLVHFSTEAPIAIARYFSEKLFATARSVILSQKFSCEFRNAMSTQFENPVFPPFDSARAFAKI
jgi:hypothetical protein